MAFGVENGGGSGTPAGRPLPYLKHALPARQENVQSLHAFLEFCVQYFAHRGYLRFDVGNPQKVL